eukprot:TRINITY_DN2901_c0_g1_i1.p1 TRINITY_DN2901_c0_g1~~TRINITY_DN2901_c0_g1_i1.p1  ORF type:complete len:305 (+),score=65.82 TRINITY_DN2901_c0_g1_i1:39-917(+)
MCGRGACTLDPGAFRKEVAKRLGGKEVEECPGREGGKWNIAPGSYYPVVREGGGDVGMVLGRWGLEGVGGRFVVNARGEGVGEKAMFKHLKRCVMFISGFYEWHSTDGDKQPYYIFDPSTPLLPLAALYNEQASTFVVLTTSSAPSLTWIHHRMPVILTDEEIEAWLDPKKQLSDLKKLTAKQFGGLKWHPVTKSVGKVAYNTPDCVKEVPIEKGGKKRGLTIGSFFAPNKKVKKAEETPVEVIDLDKEDSDVLVIDDMPPPPTQAAPHPLVQKFNSRYATDPSSILSLIED